MLLVKRVACGRFIVGSIPATAVGHLCFGGRPPCVAHTRRSVTLANCCTLPLWPENLVSNCLVALANAAAGGPLR